MSPHSSGTESQQLRTTVSPSHSSLAAKKALGVDLPPQVLSVISVAAHGTGQRKQQEDNSKRKIRRLPDGMATGKASVYRSAQNRHAAKVMGCSAYLLQTIRWLQTQAGDEQSALWQLRQPIYRLGSPPHECPDRCVPLHTPLCFRDVTNKTQCRKKGSLLPRKLGRQLWKT